MNTLVRQPFLKARFFCLFVLALLVGSGSVIAQTVASFTMTPAVGCQPLNVQFTNQSQNATSYQWNFGNGNSSTVANPSNVFTTSGSYTVTLTATGPGGAATYSQTVLVQPAPVADFTASPRTVCQGYGQVQFQNTSANYDSCVWDFGDGTKSTQFNPTHVYTIAGTFSVNLIVYNKVLGCSAFKLKQAFITVNPTPDAVLSVDTLVSCDSTHAFTFSATSLTATTNWLWNLGDGTTSTQQSLSHVYSSTGLYNPYLISTNSFGCTDTAYFNSPVQVLSNPTPITTISGTAGCTPYNVTLRCLSGQVSTYAWNMGNGNTATSALAYASYTTAGSFTPTLHVVYTNGCENQVTLPTVQVDQSPVASFTMSNYNGCSPLTVQFNNNTTSGNYTYQWNFGDGTTSTQFSPTHLYDSIGYFIPSLTVVSPFGCTSTLVNPWYYVNVNGPTAAFTPDVTSGCNPLTVNFNNRSFAGTTYAWDFGDGDTSTQRHPTHTYTANGTYIVRLIVTNAQGCKDTAYYNTIQVSNMTMNFVPPAPIHACAPYSVNFADASSASAWLWDFGDGVTSTQKNPVHTYTSPGTYVVSLRTWMQNGGCENYISNFQTIIVEGLDPGFTWEVTNCPPYVVSFHDTTSGAVSWQWTFSDGGTATGQNPTHDFVNPGYYSVTLTVTSASGCSTTLAANNAVVFSGLGAISTAFTADTVPPFHVQFASNSTNATWWIWDFGDGDSAFVSNPSHTFTSNGPFHIRLIIGNDSCQFTYDYPPITFGGGSSSGGGLGGGVINPPPVEYHCAPFTVNFSNPSQSAVSWLWDFGDGHTSTDPNPEHSYVDSGAYNPVLIMVDLSGKIDTVVYSDTYYVVEPISDFLISTTNTCAGVLVQASTPRLASTYLWNLGNNQTSNQPSVSFTYPNVSASYVISLSVSDTNGCSSFVAKSFAVNTSASISASKRRACAGDTIQFNAGNLNYASYLWIFGDGDSSTLREPTHVYNDSGLFVVTMQATDINGCVVQYQLSYQIEVFNPLASFTIDAISSDCNRVLLELTNTSQHSDSWSWNFGDGSTSTAKDPTHPYWAMGTFDITLTAYKNICKSTITVPQAVFHGVLDAGFTYSQPSLCIPATVTFTDTSLNAASWHWDFGDGDTSNVKHPVHVFTKVPTGPVTLTVKDLYGGCSKIVSKNLLDMTSAMYYLSDTAGCNPLTVAFTDSSIRAISWMWDFGDGNTSTSSSPQHTYTADGIYTVSLSVTAPSGCIATYQRDTVITVGTARSGFAADSVSGCVPLIVNFVDTSSNVTSWFWDFGDGSTSNLPNPSHVYTTPGVYSVSMVGGNSLGCYDTIFKQQYITVRGSVPYFTVGSGFGCAPFAIQFNDSSQGAVAWQWSFGDGTTGSGANPTHTYLDTGIYVVSLYTIDSTGCSTIYTMPDPIVVSDAPVSQFTVSDTVGCAPFTVTISSAGTLADTLKWIMGDGTVLYGHNPQHTYSNPGNYRIQLIAVNDGGCSDTLQFTSDVHVFTQPIAAFVVTNQTGCIPLNVSFMDSSTNLDQATWAWDFGNGDVSSDQNPAYTYLSPGNYTITLTVTNQGGCSDSYIASNLITVYDQEAPAPVFLHRVTVKSDTEVEINWPVCLDADMDRYVIWRYNNLTATYDSIAQVSQATALLTSPSATYVDGTVNTLTQVYTYQVQAIDICGNSLPLNAQRSHSTVELQASGGLMQSSLSWTPYQGCSFERYEVYRLDPGSMTYVLLASVDSATRTYVDTTAYCDGTYNYKIRTVSVCGNAAYESWSDSAQVHTTSTVHLQHLEVVRSTVVDNSYVLTEWKMPALLPHLVTRFNVYRSTDQVNFSFLASVPGYVTSFSDYEANVTQQEYYYRVEIENVCNTPSIPARINSSIWLQAIQQEFDKKLKWTHYFDWENGVEKYVIQRLNAAGQWEDIEVVPGTVTEWEEE